MGDATASSANAASLVTNAGATDRSSICGVSGLLMELLRPFCMPARPRLQSTTYLHIC